MTSNKPDARIRGDGVLGRSRMPKNVIFAVDVLFEGRQATFSAETSAASPASPASSAGRRFSDAIGRFGENFLAFNNLSGDGFGLSLWSRSSTPLFRCIFSGRSAFAVDARYGSSRYLCKCAMSKLSTFLLSPDHSHLTVVFINSVGKLGNDPKSLQT